jgi:hypothetical protein
LHRRYIKAIDIKIILHDYLKGEGPPPERFKEVSEDDNGDEK